MAQKLIKKVTTTTEEYFNEDGSPLTPSVPTPEPTKRAGTVLPSPTPAPLEGAEDDDDEDGELGGVDGCGRPFRKAPRTSGR